VCYYTQVIALFSILISDSAVYLRIKCDDLCIITHNEPDDGLT
jgi:hypothetical protein